MSDIFTLKKTRLFFKDKKILGTTDLSIKKGRITCIIGPSGAGKSTLLRSLNRMNDLTPGFRQSGEILFKGRDIYARSVKAEILRQKVGMVFQKPCLFPASIEDNVIFGIRHIKEKKIEGLQNITKKSLKAVGLWGEVSDRLRAPALELSVGQAQRLAMARAIAVGPEALLLDEPTSALDHLSARAIEDLVRELGRTMTIVMVTHRLEQARALADDVVFICDGRVCEAGEAGAVFNHPENIETRCYVGS